MAKNLAMNLVENIAHDRVGEISVMLIDDDNTSNASLISMLEKFSYKVTSVKVASEAVPMIQKQKDIELVIANIELSHINSHPFLTALLLKDIPLILITPEIMTEKASDALTKASCFCLKKPILENDIKNLWQHVSLKKSQVFEKINIAEKQKSVMAENQIEVFMENLKRPRTSQASLLGRRKFMKAFTTPEMYQRRKSVENVEWKTKPVCPIVIENKRREGKNAESNVGSRCNLWTHERHMKFLTAISILGEKRSRPKSILKIMNDPDLTHRQVSSHLQKYKTQIEQINETLPKKEWISKEKTFKYPSDYEYPFKASNLTNNLIESNSLWYSLKKKKLSTSSAPQFFFEKPSETKAKTPNIHVGEKLDLSNHSLFSNILENSSTEASYTPSTTSNNPPYKIPSTKDVNHSGLLSPSFSGDKLPRLSSLPSSVGATNAETFPLETTMIHFPIPNPEPMQSSTYVFETDRNPLDIDPISILNTHVPQADISPIGENYSFPGNTMNPFDTNMDQIGWVPSLEENSHQETNMNHIDLIPSIETNTVEMSLGPYYDEGYDVPIEDLISFDINVNEMDMNVWLENYDTSERNIHLPTSNLGNDIVSNTPTNSIPQISMESQDNALAMHQRAGMNGEENFDNNRDSMDWIDKVLNED
ncbi:unnamed protein product [Arabis nemorensis]|uniref:Response regulatory domain-containing protein n=1 Tax=Arabis nemorensis TaxID=586526 RepID=A0A565AZD5_9BRAS|nr:unnamed protein product [Arabis nemorensis]